MKNRYVHIAVAASFITIVGAPVQAQTVVIVSAKNPVANLTADQIANVYLGRDGTYAPLDLPEGAAQRDEFYTKVAGKDSAQVKAIWARLVFTGKTQPPKPAASSADAVKQVAANEKGIAYVDKSSVDSSVKAVFTVP